MLGCLELDVDKCIKFYSILIKTVFEQRSSWLPISLSSNIRTWYSSRVLKGTIKVVLRTCMVLEDKLFYDPSKNLGCKVFAISETFSKIPILIG